MKKLTALLLAILLAFGTVGLTSCDDEKDEKKDNKKDDIEIVDNKGWSPSFKP